MKIRIYPQSLLETVWQQDKLLFTPEAAQPPLCLRCGQPLDRRLVINALSRYADVHICEACGMDEALRDANRCPLPLTEWAAVKNGLSQQRTDFEDPLLTTSCTFEDLFQQGSRPASEIAYSRSDYDGWKFTKGSPFEAQLAGCDDSSWETVNIPHTWNNKDADDETPGFYRGLKESN